MKKTDFTIAVDELIEIKMAALDIFIKEYVEPLSDVGNPEKLIGKPYEQWTQGDLSLLSAVYGQGDDTPLARMIFNKKYAEVQALEEEL